jgi:hypothetical protein
MRQRKITLGEMRSDGGPTRLLIYCGGYKCAHSIEIDSFRWPDQVRLSDLEPSLLAGFAAIAAPMSGHAAYYIQSLPKTEQKAEQWQTAIRCLIGAAEGRDFLVHARIGVLRALNRHVVREFNPDAKNNHWGKRKLKRDQ